MSTRKTVRDISSPRRGRSYVVVVPTVGGSTPDTGVGKVIIQGRSGKIVKDFSRPKRGRVQTAYLTPLFRDTLSVGFVWTSTFHTPRQGQRMTSLAVAMTWSSTFNNSTPPVVGAPPAGTRYITMTPTTMPTPTIGSDGKPVQPWQPI